MVEGSRRRALLAEEFIDKAIVEVSTKLIARQLEKGKGTFASNHETFGIITEEYHELSDAIRVNDSMAIRKELIDIAVGCIFGIACIDAGTLDW